MLNVIKVKLLSERTSGVPPVIFVIVALFVAVIVPFLLFSLIYNRNVEFGNLEKLSMAV